MQRFEDDVDMNLHMLSKHMVLLDYGTFEIKKRSSNRKRSRAGDTDEHFLQNTKCTSTVGSSAREDIGRIETGNQLKTTERPVENYSNFVRNHLFTQNEEPMRSWVPGRKEQIGVEKEDETSSERKPSVNEIIIESESPVNIRENSISLVALEPDSPRGNLMNVRGNGAAYVDEQEEIIEDGGETNYQLTSQAPCQRKLSEVIDDFLTRLHSIKRLGFIRQHRSIYCIVCLKYVKSRQDCNWQHNEQEERIAELYNRRYGPKSPSGKQQLLNDLTDMKNWLFEGEVACRNGIQLEKFY